MHSEPSQRTQLMRAIKDEVFALTTSPLYRERAESGAFPVIGEGSHDARIVFVGEAPGKNEAKTGRPFCGASGKVLDALLQGVGIARSDVYITNVVKDRPPMNRDPLPEEIALYGPFLERQLTIIRPNVVVPLGRFAMAYIMELYGIGHEIKPISHIHGAAFLGTAPWGAIHVMPLYHPAVAVYNRNMLPTLQKDIAQLVSLVTH